MNKYLNSLKEILPVNTNNKLVFSHFNIKLGELKNNL